MMGLFSQLARRLALLLPLVWAAACAGFSPYIAGTRAPAETASERPAVEQTMATRARAGAQATPTMGAAGLPSRTTSTAEAGAAAASLPAGRTPAAEQASSHPMRPAVGMWLDQEELEALPMSGTAWENMLAAAGQPLPGPDMGDQNDMSDVYVLARALVYARTGDARYREATIEGIQAAIGTEGRPGRTSILALARNLPAYVIAADLVNLPAEGAANAAFRRWLESLRATPFSGDGGRHTLWSCHESRPNNFGTHCGAARVAIALYLGDDDDLARAATVFQGWLGNRQAYAGFSYGRATWQADPDNPVGINPPDAQIDGRPVGGALPEEMRRAGQFDWPPKRTQYAWEALQGAVVQAELLARAGYPAWQWEDEALLRAVQFLHEIDWEASGDDEWQPWLINAVYGADFPARSPARPGKNMGWTDWTHALAYEQRVENDSNSDE